MSDTNATVDGLPIGAVFVSLDEIDLVGESHTYVRTMNGFAKADNPLQEFPLDWFEETETINVLAG